MAGPRSSAEAEQWVRDALEQGSYTHTDHFLERIEHRGVTMPDVHHAVANCTSVTPYKDRCSNGGTRWTVCGPDLDDGDLALGVEAYQGTGKRRVILITVFDQ